MKYQIVLDNIVCWSLFSSRKKRDSRDKPKLPVYEREVGQQATDVKRATASGKVPKDFHKLSNQTNPSIRLLKLTCSMSLDARSTSAKQTINGNMRGRMWLKTSRNSSELRLPVG